MVFCYSRKSGDLPSLNLIKDAVERNFSGIEDINVWDRYFKNDVSYVAKVKKLL